MYLITNAIKNLVRNKGRNILIAAVTLAIIVSTAVTLIINNAAAKIIDDIRLDLGSRVEVRQDFIEMRQVGLGREDASYIPMENFFSFAESDYLRKAIWGANMYAWSDTLRAVDDYSETPGETTRINDNGEEVLVETLKLVSSSELDALADFGTLRDIIYGRMFSGLNECIISVDIAQLNNIMLGDVIELKGTYSSDKNYRLTVVGIYSDATEAYTNWFFAMYGRFADNRRNEIITSFDTLMEAGWETNHGLDLKTEYFLKDPDDIRRFEAEVRAKGLPVTYNVSINQAAYDKVTSPLSGMKNAVVTFMTVILILGAIVLALISFLAVRERKYEVGVLRAMGMERGKVAFGILAEAVMISALCLIIGLGVGDAMAQPIADKLLERRVAAAEATDAARGAGNRVLFAGGQMQTNDNAAGYKPESEIQVNLGLDIIMQIIIITLGLAALSGIIGVVIITQYEPLKILRESN
jgi:putative ABC transport system permease protein